MTKSEVEHAAEVLRPWMLGHSKSSVHNTAQALSATGLLRTDADRLNAELAEAMVQYSKYTGYLGGFTLETDCPARDRVRKAMRTILDARKPKPAPLDEVLSLWRECKCKVPGPLSDALDRLERERAK